MYLAMLLHNMANNTVASFSWHRVFY